jgi:hypothetical protein
MLHKIINAKMQYFFKKTLDILHKCVIIINVTRKCVENKKLLEVWKMIYYVLFKRKDAKREHRKYFLSFAEAFAEFEEFKNIEKKSNQYEKIALYEYKNTFENVLIKEIKF